MNNFHFLNRNNLPVIKDLMPLISWRGLFGLLLTMTLSFSANASKSIADDCTISEGCMDFSFLANTDNGDGTSTLCFEITNHCDKALTWAAFGLPEPALAPAHNSFYDSPAGIAYNIKNTTTNPFLSIRFKTTGQGIVDGEVDQFCFDLNTDLANSMTTFQIQGKASNYVNTVFFNVITCTNEEEGDDDDDECEDGEDNDMDGICAEDDCDDNNPNLPMTPGTICNDNNPETTNDVIQEDGCTCAGSTTEDCDNVISGGIVGLGDGGIFTSITICEDSAFVIQNNISPDGGSGDLEVIWIKSENVNDCGEAFGELASLNVGAIYDAFLMNGGSPQIGNTSWEFVMDNDNDELSLSLDSLDESACFVRCVRRVGCVPFTGESNIVSVTVVECENPEPPSDCIVTDECMDFSYGGSNDNGDGSTTICIDITNNCDKALSYAAFDIMGNALSPEDGSTVEGNLGISYHIENTTNNPFTASLKFETIGEGYKNGETDQFCFDLATDFAEDLDTLTIQTKAGQGVYTVHLPLEDCDEEPCEQDEDEDGVCAAEDCDDTNPDLPIAPGTLCDDGNPDTENDVIQDDGCSCAGTIPVVCDNVVPGGIIGLGDGGIYSTITLCEDSSLVILNNIEPMGGTGDLEVIWIKSENVNDCGTAFEELGPLNVGALYDEFVMNGGSPQIGMTSWEFVTGDTDPNDMMLTLDSLEASACFVRCARRANCESFAAESNIVTVFLDDCNIIITLEEEEEEDFIIYPNPASEIISLDLEDFLGKHIKIRVVDARGNMVRQIHIRELISEDVLLNIHEFPEGLYTVLITGQGIKPISKTFMVVEN